MYYIIATAFLVFHCSLQIAFAGRDRVRAEKSDYGVSEAIGDRELQQQCPMSVANFFLVDALNDTVLEVLPQVIDYDNEKYATGLNIGARSTKCSNGTIAAQSIRLEFDNPKVSVCRNQKKGRLFSVFGSHISSYFPLGYRTVKATPYSLPNCKGRRARQLSKTFEVKGCLDGFNFYDADTDQIFTGNLANPPCNLNIGAAISTSCALQVQSVRLKLTDLGGNVVTSHIDTVPPYLLYGDSNSNITSFQLPTGFYQITAFLNGGRGPSLSTNFTLGACTPPQLAPSSSPHEHLSADENVYCLDGMPCSHCPDGYEWWYKANNGTPGYYCGKEPLFSDGTYCIKGTSCSRCQNGYEWWYMVLSDGVHIYGTPGFRCGQENRLLDGTQCAVGTTCDRCENGYEWWYMANGGTPYTHYCGKETRYADGTYCLAGTSCDHCDNGYEWWYGPTPNGYRCGFETRFADGTYCLGGTTCNHCQNSATWWYSKNPNGYYCGAESCWGSGAYCLLGSSCDRCCNGNHYVWYLASTFCN